MQIFNTNNIKHSFSEVRIEDLNLTNENLKLLFDFFDKNKDNILSDNELKLVFDKLQSIEKDGDISDADLEKFLKTLPAKLKTVTYDLKKILLNIVAVRSGKKIANELYNNINGISWFKNTKNTLAKITPDNICDTLKEYSKLSPNETLSEALNKEFFINLNEIKFCICKPLYEKAKLHNINVKDYNDLNNIKDIQLFIDETQKAIFKAQARRTANINSINDIHTPFGKKTMDLMYIEKHKTNLLNIAQKYLGLQEVTPQEYTHLSKENILKTQMRMIKGKDANPAHQWCAHTVSSISKEAGMDIGPHKKYVQQFVEWGEENKTYKKINTTKMTAKNYKAERAKRAVQIKQQLNNMHEGDYIIWKAQFAANVIGKNGISEYEASHIGIIESVDKKTGKITVIEGNANISIVPPNGDRTVVKTKNEGIIGNQEVGEFKEINRRDGLIRKIYTIDELAKFGYSGFIDNSAIIK